MAWLVARALRPCVAPGLRYHIIQRGNRRQQTFFCDADYQTYLELMAEWCGAHGVEIWAYCVKPNHVHLIAVPQSVDGLRRAIGEAHRRYTRMVNFHEGWRGHRWQGRFASFREGIGVASGEDIGVASYFARDRNMKRHWFPLAPR